MVFLTDLRIALLVALAIAAIDIELVGVMAMLGVTISPISLVCLIMSIGISFDYVAHIAFAFMHSEATSTGDMRTQNEERVAIAILEVGEAIAKSAVSSFLGFSFLVLADAALFSTMHLVFSVALVLAIFHGYFIIPALLVYVGPPALSGASDRRIAIAKLAGSKEAAADDPAALPLTTSTEKAAMAGATLDAGTNKVAANDAPGRVSGAPVSRQAKICIWTFRGLSTFLLAVLFLVLALNPAEFAATIVRKDDAWEVLTASTPETARILLTIDAFPVPAEEVTTYICQPFTLPSYSNYHGIAYDVFPDQASVVHHMVLFNCLSAREVRTKEKNHNDLATVIMTL